MNDTRKNSIASRSASITFKPMIALLICGFVLLIAGFLIAFLYAEPVSGARVSGSAIIAGQEISNKLLISQKIFYVHMPVALVSFLALVFAGYYALRYLLSKNLYFDVRSRICAEITLLFALCTMATGVLWTRFEWGVFWTWDARLTTYLMLLLVLLAYFTLRTYLKEASKRARLSAVLCLLVLIDVPICFMVTRLIPTSIHPVVLREGAMSASVALCVAICLCGMITLAFGLYFLRLYQVILTERVQEAIMRSSHIARNAPAQIRKEASNECNFE